MSINKLSNLPFILTSKDAVLYHENLSVNLEQLSKMQPAGSYVLFLTEKKWKLKSVPIDPNNEKLENIGETENKTVSNLEQLKTDLNKKGIARVIILPDMPEVFKDSFIKSMEGVDIDVILYSEIGEVTEDDFELGEDSEDFEKRLKDLGYM